MSKGWKMGSLLLLTLAIVLSACSGNKANNEAASSPGASSPGASASEAASSPVSTEPLELTIFISMDVGAAQYMSNLSESPSIQELERRTNTKLTFIHPPVGQEQEQFNIMIASGDLPDLVMGFFHTYSGGPSQAIKDGLIIDPAPYLEENAPNLMKIIAEDPMVAKMMKNDDGEFVGFGSRISTDYEYGNGVAMVGPQIRKDLLDKLGLPIPVTIDDWTHTLRAFKENFPELEAPLGWAPQVITAQFPSAAFDVPAAYVEATNDFMIKDGTVRYSAIEPGYKDYLALMNLWYEEGLLHRDFATHNYSEHVLPLMQSGKLGAAPMHLFWYGSILPNMAPGVELTNTPLPVKEAGQQLHIRMDYGWGVRTDMAKYITTVNKHPAETVKFIDYLYSDEGMMLVNWGIEGVSYEYVNGEPKFTEEYAKDIAKNGAFYSPNPMKHRVDRRQDRSQYPHPVQHEAWELWGQADASYKLPPGIFATSEEQAVNTKVLTDANTYRDEMFLKFVMGVEPIDKFDDFVAQIKAFGIDQVTANMDAAIARLKNR